MHTARLIRSVAVPVVAAAVTLALAGCSGGDATTTLTATATVTATVTASASPSPTPTTAAAPLAVGQPFAQTGYSATVVGFDNEPTGSATSPDGERYAALQVKVCVDAGGPVSAAPWALVGADGGFYTTVVSGGGLQEPGYGATTISPGSCATGWISFVLPEATQIVQARYTPTDDDGTVLIATWTV